MLDSAGQRNQAFGGSRRKLGWSRVPRECSSILVVQAEEISCGPACGEMLFRDRGHQIDQFRIQMGMELPVDGPTLARRMNVLSEIHWVGGNLFLEGLPTWDLVCEIGEDKGSWAALLEPFGPTHVGHWVVVDGVTGDGLVLVRDPIGESYGIPIQEFLTLWHFTVLVLEGVSK